MSDNAIQDMFFAECEELIEALFEGLSQINDGDTSDETINAVFRAIHSIKGGAGAFALTPLVEFAHKFETLLDEVRAGNLHPAPDVIQVFQRSGDQIAELVEAAQRGDVTTRAPQALIDSLTDLMNTPSMQADAETDAFSFEAIALDLNLEDQAGTWSIIFVPEPDFYQMGHDPALLFAELAQLGALSCVADTQALPALSELDPMRAYLRWNLTLTGPSHEGPIRKVFEFAEGHCSLTITAKTVENEPPPSEPLPLPKKAPTPPKTTLRVELDRVDRLINTVGELIINQSMIAQRIATSCAETARDIDSELEDYKRLARDIQDAVMAIRAQPIKPLFQRMSRIVREAADATGKQVLLEFVGDTTEIDKSLIERLADPLTHMIRNAVDHGLEDTKQRQSLGKPEVGCIVLSAAQTAGAVVIEVSDDGAGLNRTKIKQIATDKGLISTEAELSDAEIDALLFLPGFSTVQEVSNLSGRGVGMDVVKNALRALGGRISITSSPNQGTTFTVTLPLTLAVMDGMLVSIGGERMVLPLSDISETLRCTPQDLHHIGTGECLLNVRGTFVPVLNVAEHFGFDAHPADPNELVMLLVENQADGHLALIVDDIFDQRQVVVKGLGEDQVSAQGISAATILGDGCVALILDVSQLRAAEDRYAKAS